MQAIDVEEISNGNNISGDVECDANAFVPTAVLSTPPQSPRVDSDEHQDNDSAPIGGKRKRVVVSIHEKQQVLQRLDAGEQPAAIARVYGISRQQVSDIKKNRERILAFCVDAKHVASLHRKTLKATSEHHPGVEQELYRWLVRMRALSRSVSSDALAHKATELFVQYAARDASVSVKAITTWLRHFKRAYGLKTLGDDELARLPDRFVAAMDMTHHHRPTTATIAVPLSASQQLHQQQSNYPISSSSATLSTLLSSIAPSGTSNGSSSGSSNSAAMGLTLPLHLTTVDDYMSGMNSVMALHPPSQSSLQLQPSLQSLPQQLQSLAAVPASAHSELLSSTQQQRLEATAAIAQDINAQLALFEREVTAKLDYLDARVEKLCLFVLPQRFD